MRLGESLGRLERAGPRHAGYSRRGPPGAWPVGAGDQGRGAPAFLDALTGAARRPWAELTLRAKEPRSGRRKPKAVTGVVPGTPAPLCDARNPPHKRFSVTLPCTPGGRHEDTFSHPDPARHTARALGQCSLLRLNLERQGLPRGKIPSCLPRRKFRAHPRPLSLKGQDQGSLSRFRGQEATVCPTWRRST